VASRVARSVGWTGSLNKLLSKVTVSPQAGADFVVIQATDTNPRRAAAIANGFAQRYCHRQ
jgi:capsular polysaccharide biosynthesis protein